MNWIEVKSEDELLEMTNILVKSEYGEVANVYFCDSQKKWFLETFGQIEIIFDSKITHWMEIP